MTHRRITLALSVIVLAAATWTAAAEKVLTPEVIVTLRHVIDAQMSPDGTHVAYQVTRPRAEDERPGAAVQEIWLAPTADGEPFRFTTSEAGDRAPQWSPDGRQLAFLSRRPDVEHTQIYVIPVDGGEARPLTRAPNSVIAFRWSPDGRRIAYTMTDPKAKEEREAEEKGRDWIVADRDYKHHRLYTIDVAAQETGLVTRVDMTVHEFDWSPDGRQLVIAAAETPTVDDSFMGLRLMTVSAAGGEPALLTPTEGKLSHPRWSPDGRWIAWLGAIARNDPYTGSVFVVPAAGGEARNLTPDYEGTGTWLGWLPGAERTLVLSSIERQATAMYQIAVPDGTRTPVPVGPAILFSGPSFTRDGTRLAFVANSPTHPNEVYVGALHPAGISRLTTTNAQLEGIALGSQEIVRWTSVDGWEIEGVLVRPVGYEAGRRYPVIVQPHGGPEAADLNGWYGTYSRWGQMLAGRGYLMFYPNYRGSIGRGPKFSMGDHRDLMGQEFQDILAGVDHLVATGVADPARVGIGGGSYGGYTSAWAATYGSDRFKAAVMWMGVSNWISMTGTTEIFWENSIVHWDAIMYESFYDLYWERSPLAHVEQANTPTLIIHGAEDTRVPIGQSQEMYTALRWKGVPVEFVTYPRAPHGVTERAHQIDFMERVTAWFDRYVKGEPVTQE